MIRFATTALCWGVFTVVAAPPATAQEADPFGAGAAPDPGAAADAPAAGGGFGISETDPAILGLRESNPQTPEQLARAVQITMNLARLDEMQVYLDKLIAGADEPAMVRLQRQFGTAFFLRLSNRRRYGDKAADFAARVIEVTATDLRQAERLQALVQQLSDVSAAARRSAMVGLQDAGVESVFGDNSDVVFEAIKDFVFAMPIALRCRCPQGD
ncbi:MAG: hypothetical protein QGG36_14605, partial [Pirellulaceae bacterium]|nr:hypothetical protein [Pirellulaceae bacterium]